MAELKITIGRVYSPGGGSVPLEKGSGARTEVLAIPGGTEGQEVSSLSGKAGEGVLTVHADQDCWISIGASPDATGVNRRFVPSGTQRQFGISQNELVSVLGAT